MKFVEWMDDLPYIVKIIFCLPGLDLIWAIYRIVKGSEKNSVGLLVVGILWAVLGWSILWILDLVTTLVLGKPILTDPL